jgi:hypothetical protein
MTMDQKRHDKTFHEKLAECIDKQVDIIELMQRGTRAFDDAATLHYAIDGLRLLLESHGAVFFDVTCGVHDD